MGTLPSPSPTDPDVRISRIRFFMREVRSRMGVRDDLVDRPSVDAGRDSSVEEGWPPRRLGYPLSFVDRFVGPESPPLFQANGSLLMTPPSPPPGPAERGSPPSQVILRR